MAAKKKSKKKAATKSPKTPFHKARSAWIQERIKRIVRPPNITREDVETWLGDFWDSTPRKKGMTIERLTAAVEKRIVAELRDSRTHIEKAKAAERAARPAPQPPYPPEPPSYPPPPPQYPSAATPCGPGQAPRRVPVPVNVVHLSDAERTELTLSLMHEESVLENLADWYRKQDAGPAAAQVERTIAAVRGDIIRVRFRGCLWSAIGHLERLAELAPEPEGAPEIENHLQRLDRALQAAVVSIVREMNSEPEENPSQ